MQQGRAQTLIYDVSIEPPSIAYLDDLPRPPARVNEAIGRIVTPVRPGCRVDDRDAGPIVVGRCIDHRHSATHRSVVPVCVVHEDLMRADYPRDDRDMTGRNLPGALVDEDRSNSRLLPALVAPGSLVPPSAGRAVERHAGFGASIKRAIGCSRRFYRRHKAGNETRAPSEALRHHRSHFNVPRAGDGRRSAAVLNSGPTPVKVR